MASPTAKPVAKVAVSSAPGRSVARAAVRRGGVARAVGTAARFLPVPGAGIIGAGVDFLAGKQEEAGFRAAEIAAFQPGGFQAAMPADMMGGVMPAGVVKTWTTGTANFMMLADGRIAVQRRNGTIKTYRPYRSIVLGKRINVSQISRAVRRLSGLAASLNKILVISRPKARRTKKR